MEALASLQVQKRQRRRIRAAVAPLPTWGQVKRLTTDRQKMLTHAGKTSTAENLFLSTCALLTVSSAEGKCSLLGSYSKSAFI